MELILILKCVGACLLLVAAYLAYIYLIAPLLAIRRYRKYKNVYINEKFIPVVGEGAIYREDLKNGKASYYHQIEFANKMKGIDLKLTIIADRISLYLLSNQALQEFQSLSPEFIDRSDFSQGYLGKVFAGSFGHDRSNEVWKKRRDIFMKEIGINFSSRFIPLMIEATAERAKMWKSGQNYEMLSEMADITFTIISKILFGESVIQKIDKGRYEDLKSGEVEYLPFNEMYTKVSNDANSVRYAMKSFIFPCLRRYDISHPYNVIKRNINELWRIIGDYLIASKDEDSVYARVMKTGEISQKNAIQDIIGFLFAGHETSSHSISSALFFLTKNTKVADKLEQELSELKGLSVSEFIKAFSRDKIHSYDYLYQVVKESLRFDVPVNLSLPYVVLKDTTICDVPIHKGTMIQLGLIYKHFDPSEWKDPLEFIPERFNPESEYYLKPNSDNSARSPHAYIPFSFWLRNCPGQSLALLEIRTIVAYLFLNYKFRFEEKILNSPYSYFGVLSGLKMNFTIDE